MKNILLCTAFIGFYVYRSCAQISPNEFRLLNEYLAVDTVYSKFDMIMRDSLSQSPRFVSQLKSCMPDIIYYVYLTNAYDDIEKSYKNPITFYRLLSQTVPNSLRDELVPYYNETECNSNLNAIGFINPDYPAYQALQAKADANNQLLESYTQGRNQKLTIGDALQKTKGTYPDLFVAIKEDMMQHYNKGWKTGDAVSAIQQQKTDDMVIAFFENSFWLGVIPAAERKLKALRKEQKNKLQSCDAFLLTALSETKLSPEHEAIKKLVGGWTDGPTPWGTNGGPCSIVLKNDGLHLFNETDDETTGTITIDNNGQATIHTGWGVTGVVNAAVTSIKWSNKSEWTK